jgi:hypothetical protein
MAGTRNSAIDGTDICIGRESITLIVRPYTDADLDAVLDLHRRQGLGYELPVLDECPVSCVIEEGGNITHAVFVRQTSEIYWLFDGAREWKRQTLGRFLVLHKEIEPVMARAGFTDVHAFVPPKINNPQFEHTMVKLGWQKSSWPCYGRLIVGSENTDGICALGRDSLEEHFEDRALNVRVDK